MGKFWKVKEAAVAFPAVASELQHLQLACGGEDVWQQSLKFVALKVKTDKEWGSLKEARAEEREPVEGEVESP